MSIRQNKYITQQIILLAFLFSLSLLSFSLSAVVQEKSKVLVLPIKTEINDILIYSVRRAFGIAQKDEAIKAIILDMDTPGGRSDIMEEIIHRIRASKIPVYTFVRDKAISAGAIISFATKAIYMAPYSRIGDAAPILFGPSGPTDTSDRLTEKMESPIRALVRSLAKENGHDPMIALAMIDIDLEYKIGDHVVSKKGELLTLTAEEAIQAIRPGKQPLLAEAITDTIDDLLEKLNLDAAEVIHYEPSGAEYIASWITLISPFLVLLFMIGLFTASHFPLMGIVAIVAFILFSFGHYIAGLAGLGDIMLIALGILLLLAELLIIPGFGIAGIAGIVLLLTGLVLAMLPYIPSVPKPSTDLSFSINLTDYLVPVAKNILLTIGLAFLSFFLLRKYLPKSSMASALILESATASSEGYIGIDVETHRKRIGQTGIAITDLHPSGIIMIGTERIDVVSAGDFIPKDSIVCITAVNGPRIIVETIPPSNK